jgi:glycosyl transferase family 2
MIKLTAVMVVRNEADLLDLNLRYHAAQGVSDFRIVDNGSSDATAARLRALAKELKLSWTIDHSGYHQADIVTELAAEAFRAGADWILPVDADEFWSAGASTLAQALATCTAEAIEARVVNFIQDRHTTRRGAAALLTMSSRARALHPYDGCRALIEARQLAFVEMEYPNKWLPRATAGLRIRAGAHGAAATSADVAAPARIVCLHAPIRSRQVLEARAEHGRRLIEAGYPPEHGWHNQRWQRLQLEQRLDAEWESNSTRAGYLELGSRRAAVVPDFRLRDAVRPWAALAAAAVGR